MKAQIYFQINRSAKLARNKIKRNKIKKERRIKRARKGQIRKAFNDKLNGDYSYDNIVKTYLSQDIQYLLYNPLSFASIGAIYDTVKKIKSSTLMVPENFSIIDYPDESYEFIRKLVACLIYQPAEELVIDYGKCKNVDLASQVLIDIIQKEVISFYKRCRKSKRARRVVNIKSIRGFGNKENKDIDKMLFSVGSPALLTNSRRVYSDIVPYRLCIHTRNSSEMLKVMEKKEIHTTELVDYVINSLARLNKSLTPDKIDDLCTVIGEILINAEEHSTIGRRFSIGYFQETNIDGKHCGIFRLVILNFGQTIYEKFKDPSCKNKSMVDKMKLLSYRYTASRMFAKKLFEEETLWTLYALQEGVTSVAPTAYKRRGNGSIRFIESFFNMKGKQNFADDVSKMVILSGNASITFDGTYGIVEEGTGDERFKKMTFNLSGRIEDKPDDRFVKFVDDYFPGTIIGARILFNEDDTEVLTLLAPPVATHNNSGSTNES